MNFGGSGDEFDGYHMEGDGEEANVGWRFVELKSQTGAFKSVLIFHSWDDIFESYFLVRIFGSC